MKRALFVLTALLLACPVLMARDSTTKDADTVKAVVVAPMDLRKPVPDPEKELTEKYDGKTVRFTGLLQTFGQDAKKTYWYDLQTEVAQSKSQAKAKASKEVVTVRVYFQNDAKTLRTQRARQPLTVEGTGEIQLPDGSLVIRNAVILDAKLLQLERASKR